MVKLIFIYRQAFAQSDPGVRSLDRRPYCTVCKNNNHYTRGCPVRIAGPAMREDDALVAAFLTTRAEEPEGQRGLLEKLGQ